MRVRTASSPRCHSPIVLPDLVVLGYFPRIEALFTLIGSAGYEGPAALSAGAVREWATTLLRIQRSGPGQEA